MGLVASGGEGGRSAWRRQQGLRRDERGLEEQRGRSRGKEGEGRRCEWWLNMSGCTEGRHVVESAPFRGRGAYLTVYSSRYGRPTTWFFYYRTVVTISYDSESFDRNGWLVLLSELKR